VSERSQDLIKDEMYTIVGYNGTLTAESAALEITKWSDRSCVWKPFRKELLFGSSVLPSLENVASCIPPQVSKIDFSTTSFCRINNGRDLL
jgi:hypothetical protein